MTTSKIVTALGAAVLLLGVPGAYAAAGEGKPDRPGGVHECEDGLDNDGDGAADFGADADCGSARDNSEAAEDEAEEPGGTPALPVDPQAIVEEVLAQVQPAEEEPCEGEDCPPPAEEQPAPDPAAELQAVVQQVLDALPSGGGELPVAPPTQAEVEAAVADLLSKVPPPPAG